MKFKNLSLNSRDSKAWSFYCPLCRATRRVARHPRPQPIHFLQVALTAIVVMIAGWPWFAWKGIFSFVPLWIGFEIIYRSKARASLNCPHCGFDPYLYLVDIQRARQEIESHWRRIFAEKGVPFPEKNPEKLPENPAPPESTVVH